MVFFGSVSLACWLTGACGSPSLRQLCEGELQKLCTAGATGQQAAKQAEEVGGKDLGGVLGFGVLEEVGFSGVKSGRILGRVLGEEWKDFGWA